MKKKDPLGQFCDLKFKHIIVFFVSSTHQIIEVHSHTKEKEAANNEWCEKTLQQKDASMKHLTLTYQSQWQFIHDNWHTQKIVHRNVCFTVKNSWVIEGSCWILFRQQPLELEADDVGDVVDQLDVEEGTQGTNIGHFVFSIVLFGGIWKTKKFGNKLFYIQI